MSVMTQVCFTDELVLRCGYLANSFARWLKRPLIADMPTDPLARAQALYDMSSVLVSHGTGADPVFWFANRAAQRLWDMDWKTFTTLPSRLSAEPDEQAARSVLLARAERDGYISDYSGVRVSRLGQRFRIRDVVLWNIRDDHDQPAGQAAMFAQWDLLA
jgi:MEKHLA domain